jgi:mannose-6-phosphate isomerase-like protein (cupin superfamily)
MIIVNRERAKVLKTAHGSEIRPLVDRSSSDITQCSLAEEVLPPGHAVLPHHHQRLEEIYYILTGRGMMTVGSEQQEVGPGDAIYIPREHRHTLENTGTEPIRLLVACGPAFFYEDEIRDTKD